MIKSMTAYAVEQDTRDDISIALEIRSYNSRYLDVVLRLPHRYNCLEEKIKGVISKMISRGRIEIKLKISDNSDDSYAFEVNKPKAQAYYDAVLQLRDTLNIDAQIPLGLVTGAEGVIKPAEAKDDQEKLWPHLRDCMVNAMKSLDLMRKQEGDFMAKDFAVRIDYIEKTLDRIEKGSSGLLSQYQEKLKERISALTRGLVEIDPGRIAQEAAILADKSDIAEEIVRSRSHIKQFRTIMDSKEPGGRKLNFLLQEFNREFNTMGSKTGNADVSHMVVDLKSELEKIREQVQNVE
jgi:uncharacterized protein (TIGR00255 family)